MKKRQGKAFGFVLALAWALASGSAFAQWQWIDADGRKIFSDKAPPPTVPDAQILRGGDGRPYKPVGKVQNETAPTYGFHEYQPEPEVSPKPQAASAVGQKSPTKTPKELEQEKKAEAERLAKEAEAKRKEQERKASNCKIIRGNLSALDSGRRLASFNEKGDRTIMGDAERSSERARLDEALKENQCN